MHAIRLAPYYHDDLCKTWCSVKLAYLPPRSPILTLVLPRTWPTTKFYMQFTSTSLLSLADFARPRLDLALVPLRRLFNPLLGLVPQLHEPCTTLLSHTLSTSVPIAYVTCMNLNMPVPLWTSTSHMVMLCSLTPPFNTHLAYGTAARVAHA